MRKYIVGLFVFGLTFFGINCINAQTSEVFAGGEIYAKYIGDFSETCSQPIPYEITLRFFRDNPYPVTSALPGTKDVYLVDITSKDPLTWVPIVTVVLDNFVAIPQLDNICINSNDVITDGGYYSNTAPVMLDADKRYKIVYGTPVGGGISFLGIDYHSPANASINAGQQFFLKTEVHTFCNTVITGPDDIPPNEQVSYHSGQNQAPLWKAKTEILETLCEGNSYRFDLNEYVYDEDKGSYNILDLSGNVLQGPFEVRDSFTYDLISVRVAEDQGAVYSDPSNVFGGSPFPTAPSDPFMFNKNTGVMTFTPQLSGEKVYTAPLTFEVTEWKKTYELENDGTGNFIRRERWDTATVTQRQFRFLIAESKLCNDNLPTVVSDKFNQVEQAWEFDCASKVLDFKFDKPMLYKSLSLIAPFDFRIFRGTDPMAPIDQSAYEPDAIIVNPGDINGIGEFYSFKLIFSGGLGPGRYTLFTKTGNDANTVENRCGFFMPEFQLTPFIINREYEYIFKDDDKSQVVGSQKVYCYPGDEPTFNLDALKDQGINIVKYADLYTFSFRGTSPNAPASLVDVTQLNNSTFNVYNTITIPEPYDFPNTPLGNETQGFWRVGVGLNYPWYDFDGKEQDERCYDDDVTLVSFRTHPRVSTVDIDLCRQDRWPVIRDLIDPKYKVPGGIGNPISYQWAKLADSVRTVVFYDNLTGTWSYPGDTVKYSIAVGGTSNGNSQASGNVNDTLDLELGVGTGVGFKSVQRIKVIVSFLNECKDSNIVKIVKQDVNVAFDTGVKSKDTIICRDESFAIANSIAEEYLRPEFMSRQWYFGLDAPTTVLQGDTTDTLSAATMKRNGRGWYKLIVTKVTESSTCDGADSIFVNIADSLTETKPECSIVTFDDGKVRQRFYWPTVDGAEKYEVRGVNQNGVPLDSVGTTELAAPEWYKANDTYGIHHWISGQEVRLYVRAVNLEVPEGAPCKYGEPALAEACEVVVKPTNIFTPNGDGINDLLRFDLLELFEGNKLQIFNRWGKLVFESANYQNDWDGGDLKDGTYFYVLDIDDPSGIQDIFKGTITIVR